MELQSFLIIYVVLLVLTIVAVLMKKTDWTGILFVALFPVYFIWIIIDLFRTTEDQQNSKQTGIQNDVAKADVQSTESEIDDQKEVEEKKELEVDVVENKKEAQTIIEENLELSMVDFFKEHAYIIKLGLASSKPDIEYINWYRILANDGSNINPKDGLLFKNARIICDGKISGLGCDGVVKLIHPELKTQADHFLIQMEGPLRFLSKCQVTCSCGISFMIYADATVGKANECYLIIVTTQKPENLRISVRPFFEAENVSLVSLQNLSH